MTSRQMMRDLPRGNAKAACALAYLITTLELELSMDEVQELINLCQSMTEVTKYWMRCLQENNGVLPPEWNGEEEISKMENNVKFDQLKTLAESLAHILVHLMRAQDLDLEDIRKIWSALGTVSVTKLVNNIVLQEAEDEETQRKANEAEALLAKEVQRNDVFAAKTTCHLKTPTMVATPQQKRIIQENKMKALDRKRLCRDLRGKSKPRMMYPLRSVWFCIHPSNQVVTWYNA